jgi:hypothetical protein
MTSSTHHVHGYADVQAALAAPQLIPPPVADGAAPVGTTVWLRSAVARFSPGETHARRRAMVEADLARLDPAALRRTAAGAPADAEPGLTAVHALAEALGLAEPAAVAQAVAEVAGTYFGGEDAAADAAVAWLLPRVAPAESGPELAANRIGLLVQAFDATAGLVGNARRCPAEHGDPLTETLRHDPPVRTVRRTATSDVRIGGVTIAQGDLVVLDIAAANRDPDVFADPDTFDPDRSGPPSLTFGAGPHRCPGRDHALALAAGMLDKDPGDDSPVVDDRDPAELLAAMMDRFPALVETWTVWDGKPVPVDDRVYTPHKSVRRIADHLLDHLAELEARLAGEEPQPDRWHASTTTTDADLAPFTDEDLDEARSRLTRLTRIWVVRLNSLTPEQLDRSPGHGWTFRQLAVHLTGSIYYADALGDLRGSVS